MAERTKKIAIGIDLGTTNSAVGVWWNDKAEITENKEGNRITPSYAYIVNNEILVGRMAKTRLTTNARNVLFDAKRLLAETTLSSKLEILQEFWPFKISYKYDDENQKAHYLTSESKLIPPERVSTEVLKALLNDVCRRFDVQDSTTVETVITVPAYFNMNQKRATMEAAKAAGINIIQLLSEPVAAAISYQYETKIGKFKDGETVFVFDLGGGTFDVTIMKIENNVYKVKALGGDPHLGGRDFDNILAKMIEDSLKNDVGSEAVKKLKGLDKYQYRLLEIARTTKEALTTTQNEIIALSDLTSDAQKDYTITLTVFEERAKELIDKIQEHCVSTIRDAKLKPDEINHIVLVGGSSKMNFVKRIISEIFGSGRTGTKNLNADEAIAKGATVFAAKLLGVASDNEIRTLNVQDALPLSIGIEIAGNKFKPILQHNSPIPSKDKITLTTSENSQQTAMVPIYEGLSENIDEDNYIAEIQITGIPKKKAREVKIEVTLELDINGILKAEAKILETDIVVKAEIKYDSNFSANEVEDVA